jgi:TonB-linked SusC/RagA family outer membrane protein
MSPKKFLIAVLFISVFPAVHAQINVSGIVSDPAGEPLIGVTVRIVDSSAGTITDMKGKYSITVPKNQKFLEFLYVGFATQRVPVNNRQTIDVTLKEWINELDEVTVVGYGSMKKRDVTGAVGSVSAQTIEERTPVNIYDALQGKTAGVQIVTGSGAPGETSEIRIRGVSTFDEGAKPLFVVDGVAMDNVDNINPNDIESIEVLKDAASAAIYGSRSANGVILVTTKKGEKNHPRIDIRYLHSYSTLSRNMPRANGAERRYYDEIRKKYLVGGEYLINIVDTLAPLTNRDVDLVDLIFRPARRNQVDFSASGASDVFNYYIGTAYLNESGIIVNSDFDRLTSRINTEYKPVKNVAIGNKIQLAYSSKNGIDEDGVLNSLLVKPAYLAVLNDDGSYVPNISARRNPLAIAMTDVNKTQTYRASLYQYLDWNIVSKLRFNASVQLNYYQERFQRRRASTQLSTEESGTPNSGSRDRTALNYDITNENYLTYTDTWGDYHDITAMIGNSINYGGREQINLLGMDMTSDIIYTLNAASYFDPRNTSTGKYESSMLSWYGRFTYNYKGKYLANFNLRYDGSSRFGRNNPWGFFPSASAGWRFSDEKFMRFAKRFLTDSKIRASIGVTGNQQIGNYDAWQLYSPNYIYSGLSGIAASNLPDANLSWEKTTQYNTGLDFIFFRNRLRVSVDYYKKQTDNLLAKVELPKETGFLTTRRNVGAMTNEGAEFSLEVNIVNNSKWKWSVNANWANNNTVIVRVADDIPFYRGLHDAIYVQPNARLGEFYGYQYAGIFAYDESNAFTPNGERLTPVFSNGIFQDVYYLNGTPYAGEIKQKTAANGDVLKGGDVDFIDSDGNWLIDLNDKKVIGCAQPDFYGGFGSNLSYKNLSLSATFYYSIGGRIYNYALARQNAFEFDGVTPTPEAIQNMWTKQGDNARYPIPKKSEHNRLAPSDFYLEDASYVKLKSAKLTYRFPKEWLAKLHIKSVNVYVYGNNLLTFTNYTGYDPEFSRGAADALTLGIDSNSYPRKRELGMGMNVNF